MVAFFFFSYIRRVMAMAIIGMVFEAAHSTGEDVDLLLEFKRNVVDGDASQALASWLPSARQDYCTWNGITCRRDGSRTWVDAILLPNSDLEFNMWDGFARFERLRYINFSSNSVAGSLPAKLGNLKNLVSLDLGMNFLEGKIPSSMGSLPSLDTVVLTDNNMVGEVPNGFCNGNKLRVFDASINKFTSTNVYADYLMSSSLSLTLHKT